MIRGTHRPPHREMAPRLYVVEATVKIPGGGLRHVCNRARAAGAPNPVSTVSCEAPPQQSLNSRRSARSFNSLVRGAPATTVEGMAYIRLYFGPLPPSRGVQRGPSTSVALQSTQFGAFTRSRPSTSSYTPAGHTWA